MNRYITNLFPWIMKGFVVGVLISLLVGAGVIFLLSVIKNLKLPEHEILLFTVLFYGIIFFIAYAGVRVNTRRSRALISKNTIKDLTATPKRNKFLTDRAKNVLWNIITIVSLAWLTPVLVIYWMAPRHPGMAVAVCCFLFSLVGATAYLFKSEKQIKTVYERLVFFMGVCSGVLIVVRFFPGL